jgi:type IV pilus assembly protein PilZ
MADSDTKGGAERRIFTRKSVSVSVGMQTEHGFWNGFAENISEGGIFISTHAPFDMGTEVDVSFALAMKGGKKKVYRVHCEVRWIRPDSGGGLPPGMGLKFMDLTDKANAEIQDYIARGLDIIFMDVDD